MLETENEYSNLNPPFFENEDYEEDEEDFIDYHKSQANGVYDFLSDNFEGG